MHCPRSSSGCSSMQGICAQLTGEDLCLIALCYANIFGVAVCNASMLDWPGGSICLLHICIVLDLAVGVVVCKASVLNWPGGPSVHLSIYMHCPRSSSGCSGMQGICARLTREGHMKCNSIQGIYAWLTGGLSEHFICQIWVPRHLGVVITEVFSLHVRPIIYATWAHWLHLCNQEHCTQMTKVEMMQDNCAAWLHK